MKRNLLLFLLMASSIAMIAQRTVTGVVTDQSGEGLIGANLLVKGTNVGTITDIDGSFSIEVPQGSNTLVASFTGFETQELDITGQSTIEVVMSEGSLLDEVVVVAYGQESKGSVASAITTVSSEAIAGRANGSVVQLLQAQAPGLNISTGTGQPGGNSLVLIRGVTSLSGNVEPLFVIDGVPVDEDNFRSLNPTDIENVSILKDASASGLYGNRASGGVIVVTTKQGKFNQPISVSYSGMYGTTSAQNPQFQMADTRQILELERRRGVSVGSGNISSFLSDQIGVTGGAPLTDAEIDQIASRANTSWNDIFLRNGVTQNHNLSVSGGGENTTLFANFGYFDQEGIARRSDLERFNLRTNLTMKAGNFRTKVNLSANFSRSNEIPNEFSGNLDNPFLAPYVSKPYYDPLNEDGTLNLEGDGTAGFANTPYLTLNESILSTNNDKEIKTLGNIRFEYDFLENLMGFVSGGIDFTEIINKNIQSPETLRARNGADTDFRGTHFEAVSRDTRKNLQTGLTYNTTLNDKHFFKVSGYTELINDDVSGFSLSQFGLFEGLIGNGASFVPGNTQEDGEFLYIPGIGSFQNNVAQFSYFGVLKYDYDGKYGAEFSGRRDASSRFSKENRWGTFWSAAARWNITEEEFMKDNGLFNNLKLRLSYGLTGNDRIFGGHYSGLDETFDLFNLGSGYLGAPALFASQIANPDLRWETTAEFNVGIDFGILKNRVSGNIDLYSRRTTDVFAGQPNTLVSGGFGSIGANVATMSNRGIEVFLSADLISKRNGFNWNVYFNGSYNKNNIEALPSVEANDNGEVILDRSQRAVEAVGHPFNSFFVVEWAGVNPANGNPLFKTREGGVTEQFRDEDRVFTGKSSLPTYQGGFGTTVSYKGFNINAAFAYVADIWRNNGTFGVVEDVSLLGVANMSVTLLDAWENPGDVTAIPSLSGGSTRNLLTDQYLEDASYLRLRTLTAGYTFSNLGNKGLPIKSARIFVQGENLLTWTAWRGFDPEFNNFDTSDFFAFPNPRNITVGLDINF